MPNHIHADAGPGKHAVAVDPKLKAANLNRLRRIEGQIRGIQRMVEEDRYCADILVQVSAAQEALRKVASGLLENHLRHCASHALNSTHANREAMFRELVDLFGRYAR